MINEHVFHVLHQALFGGLAAVGFAVLFNCRPRMLPICFAAGVLTLAVRSMGQELGLTLPVASFFAALSLAFLDHLTKRLHFQSPQGTILVLGAIPMIPGSLAAKVLISVFALLRNGAAYDIGEITTTWENLVTLIFTLAAIGTALALPALTTPQADLVERLHHQPHDLEPDFALDHDANDRIEAEA